jgi:hypothetical protein
MYFARGAHDAQSEGDEMYQRMVTLGSADQDAWQLAAPSKTLVQGGAFKPIAKRIKPVAFIVCFL